jgi:subtilisin family serine protease
VLVRFDSELSESAVRARLGPERVASVRRFHIGARPQSPNNRLYHLRLSAGWTVEAALGEIARRADVELVQPNYLHRKADPPDDPYFSLQWGLENTGEPGYRGLLGPDPRAGIDAPEAWELIEPFRPTMDTVIVGIIDTGVDYTHEDLASRMWVNPDETAGNGLDDDGNGYVDDIYGYDFAYNDDDPMDGDGHGTHVAGSIAAVTNNSTGVAGTFGPFANAEIMALKFLDDSGSGTTADAIEAIYYAIDKGAKVLNNSWGGGAWEASLYTAIADAYDAGVLFPAAAGNDGTDNDWAPHWPSNYDVPNVISVGASNRWGLLTDYSNYGMQFVDIAAPGDEILSTTPDPSPGSIPDYTFDYEYSDWGGYAQWGGTSMAAPFVSGAVALVYALGHELLHDWSSMSPVERVIAVRNRLLERVDPTPDLQGRIATGGRLNLYNLVEPDTIAPASVVDLEVINPGADFVTLRFTASGDDDLAGRANFYDLRYAESPLWTTFENATPVPWSGRPRDAGQWDYMTATGLAPATDYTFQLQVLDNAGNGSLSNTVNILTAPAIVSFEDDMEGGSSGWTTQSNQPFTWQLTDEDSHSPTHAWSGCPGGPCPDSLDSSLISSVIDLTTAVAAKLTFWYRFDLQARADYGYVEATANGLDWQELARFTGASAGWQQAWVDLTGYAGGTCQFRFRLETDASVLSDAFLVDDAVVRVTFEVPSLSDLNDEFNDTGNWDLGEGYWGPESGRLSDSPGGPYGDNQMSTARLNFPLDLSTREAAALSFDLQYDTEEAYDFLYLQLSTDGQSWRSRRRWTGTSPLHRVGLDLSEYAGYPEIWLRFLSSTSASIAQDGVSIDNLRVETKSMPDGDSDGVVDLFDCEPTDDGAFAPPTEIQNLRWRSNQYTLEWDSDAPNCGPDVVYDVVRGYADELPFGTGPGEICLADSTSNNHVDETHFPDPGQVCFYLVRAANVCDVGTYGYDTGPAGPSERLSGTCP